MKHIHKRFHFAVFLIFIALASCNKTYLDVNNDPNRPTDENVTPELIFTQAEVTSGIRQVGGQAGSEGGTTDIQFAQNWIGYMAQTGDFAPNQTEISYNIDFAFGDNSWQRDYSLLFDLYLAKTKAIEKGDTVLAGAAMILSAKKFQELVDTYGDIPYSQAFQSNQYSHPAYDAAEDIYNSLLLSLDTAISYMGFSAKSNFATVDVINHGDQEKWIKFANTLKLRLLIRQSEVPEFNPSSEISKIESAGGVLEAGESITVNPGYSNSQYKQSPFYGNYGYTTTGNKVAVGYTANNYILNILTATGDPRIGRYFTPAAGTSSFVGADYGLLVGNPVTAQSSYFGPGLAGSAEQDQWIYPSFESMFLKAEAIARGWIEGDLQTALNDAITESFVWLGVPDAVNAAATYISNNPEITDVSNAGTTADSRDAFVVFQKYLALVGIDPLEAWADERRLHFLPPGYISVNPNRISNTLPLRLLYPQSEYTTNAENVQAVGNINQFTTKIFWEP